MRVTSTLRVILPWLLLAAGISAMILSGFADLLGITQGGFGAKRALLGLAGFSFFVLALVLKSRAHRAQSAADSLIGEPPNVFLIGVWFGLVTGLAELLFQITTKGLLNQSIYIGIDFLWMILAADLIYFGVLGIVLYMLNRRWPKLISVQVATFVCALLACSLLLFLTERLQTYSVLLFAAGLAFQTARVTAGHPDTFRQVVHRSLGWTAILAGRRKPRGLPHDGPTFDPKRRELLAGSAAIVAGLAIAVQARQLLGEVVTTSKLAPQKPGALNVLLIVLDTIRAQSLSLYGYSRSTSPQLALLAQKGVLFKSALSTASWTLPSHASMFTGRYAHELSADRWTPLDAAYPTLAEVLSAQGYATGGFAANNLYCTTEQGLNRGFAHYEDFAVSPGQAFVDSELGRLAVSDYRLRSSLNYYDMPNRKRAQDVNDSFLHWLSFKGPRPFFAFLNYFDGHDPYQPPTSFAEQFGSARRTDLVGGFISKTDAIDRPDKWQLSLDEIAAAHDAYDASIAYMDDQIGRLLGELEKRGELQNTLVIVTADHGEHFGEHGLYIHGNSLYLPLLHVPLLISLPGRVTAGKQIDEFVSLRDLPATILDVLGLSVQDSLPGNSFARLWNGQGPTRGSAASPLLSEVTAFNFRYMPEWWPVGKGSMKSLVMDRYHYIKNTGSGLEELYDLVNDPREEQDLAGSTAGGRILTECRASLDTILALR